MIGNFLGAGFGDVVGPLAAALLDGLGRGAEPPGNLDPDGCWFRASGIADLCPRHVALAARGRAPWRPAVDAATGWAMARGTGNHAGFQAALTAIAGRGGVELLGGWRHEDGSEGWLPPQEDRPYVVRPDSKAHVGWGPRPSPQPGWTYVECAGVDPGLRLRGHWDGVLRWPDGRLEILEIKSWPAARRRAVAPEAGGGPLEKHVEQVHCYMHLAGVRAARVVYLTPEDLPGALAEHAVAWSDDVWARIEARLRAARAATRLVAADPDGRALPDRLPACGSRGDARAKACAGRDACLPARGARWV